MNGRSEVFVLENKEDRQKLRLDVFLTSRLQEFSRSRIQALIREGLVRVDDKVVRRAGLSLWPGARVEVQVPPPRPASWLPENIPLNLLFENEDVLVIDKPAGMVVHPAPGHERGTLVHAVMGYAPSLEGIGGEERPGIVHRLDKDTSGLLLVAKNERAQRWLQTQFQKHRVEKTYLALVDGAPPTLSGRIEAPIGRHSSNRKLMAIVSPQKGREAISEYHTLERFPHHTLLEVHPLTGRTHQIRVHLAFLGCPVAGDRIYGRRSPTIPLSRHFLHAFRLKITLPGERQPRLFEAPLPADLQEVLESLRLGVGGGIPS